MVLVFFDFSMYSRLVLFYASLHVDRSILGAMPMLWLKQTKTLKVFFDPRLLKGLKVKLQSGSSVGCWWCEEIDFGSLGALEVFALSMCTSL